MRRSSAFACASIAVLALAGCGGANKSSRDDRPQAPTTTTTTSQASPPPASAGADSRISSGPDVAPTAAPGVAFNYQHSFALQADRIAAVQEEHAKACEALGVSRCRITGMSYRRRNAHEIDGMLEFRLDPALARRFGQEALGKVEEAGGLLVESRITGTDVGTGIRAESKTIEQLNEELRRLQQQIADRSTPASQKDILRAQADGLRAQIRDRQSSQEAQLESLATTPVTFTYGTDEELSGGPNFAGGLRKAGDTAVWGLYGLMMIAITVAPFVAILLILIFGTRWLRRRFGRAPVAAPHVENVAWDAPPPDQSGR